MAISTALSSGELNGIASAKASSRVAGVLDASDATKTHILHQWQMCIQVGACDNKLKQ